jgi:hypothetical protein
MRWSIYVRSALSSIALLGSVGCGAKTGLLAPDLALDAQASDAAERDVVVDVPRTVCLEPPTSDADIDPITVNLSIAARVGSADVLFVMDRTGSMSEEIDNIRQSLRTVIVPGLVATIPDLYLGMVTYADFPLEPYGSADDRPFALERPMGRDISPLQGALATLRASGGGDNPEALTEALYQVATGAGLRANMPGRTFWIPPSGGCSTPGIGYACVRQRATPILVVITDAPTHNGPSSPGSPQGSLNYNNAFFTVGAANGEVPHTYMQTVTALQTSLGAKMIGIHSGLGVNGGRADLEAYARTLNSLARDGTPLVYDINPDGTGLSEQVVSSVTQLINELRLDVSARAVDLDGSGVASLVQAVRPRSAEPMANVRLIANDTFLGVIPGTIVSFDLVLDRARVVRQARTRTGLIRVEFLDRGRPTLGSTDVQLVIPGTGQMGCE